MIPDEVVLPTAKDLAEGKDPALARAAELAGVHLDAAQAGRIFRVAANVRMGASDCPGWQVSSATHARERRTMEGCEALD